MTKHWPTQWIGSLAVLLMSIGAAEAAPIFYFGEDAGVNNNGIPQITSFPSSDAARDQFLGTLSSQTTNTLRHRQPILSTGLGTTRPRRSTSASGP